MKSWVALLLLLSSCHYKFQDPDHLYSDEDSTTISVPYIKGDSEGQLNQAVILAIAEYSSFEYRKEGGALTLDIAILTDTDQRIGFRYDRDPTTGARRPNVLGSENRRSIQAEVKLIDAYAGKVVAGPFLIQEEIDFDYVESSSIRDLTFTPPKGPSQTVIDFSLGQLDVIEDANEDARIPLYAKLAEKIARGISHLYTPES